MSHDVTVVELRPGPRRREVACLCGWKSAAFARSEADRLGEEHIRAFALESLPAYRSCIGCGAAIRDGWTCNQCAKVIEDAQDEAWAREAEEREAAYQIAIAEGNR
jgi:hypothetical protein